MFHWPTFIVGLVSLALLFIMHKFTPRLPSALIVLFLAIIVSTLLDFESLGIHVVGEIPAGLPDFGIPEALGLQELVAVAPGAIGVALVAFAESLAIARSFVTRYGYEVDANVATIGVLAFGLLEGLIVAALLGLVTLLFGSKQRSTFVLGKVPETAVYRSLAHYPDGETYPGLLIIRFDGTLFFANAHDFVVAVRRIVEATDPAPKVVMLDGESINSIDATAVMTLQEFYDQLNLAGIEIHLARLKLDVLAVMESGGLEETIPREHIYPSVQAGVDAYLSERL